MNIEYSFLDFISEVDPTGQHSNELVELYKKRLDEMDSRSTNYFAFEDKVGLPFNSEGTINSQRLAFIEFLGKEEFDVILNPKQLEQKKLDTLLNEYFTNYFNNVKNIESLIIGYTPKNKKGIFKRFFGYD